MGFGDFGNSLLSKYSDISIIFPEDSSYEAARQLYNRMHNLYPAMIIRTQNQSALKELIQYVALNEIELAIRGGGHHIAGFGSTQGGILLDFPFAGMLSLMKRRGCERFTGCSFR